ncbi:ABC-F family ATP-binding cassette domain-containing protein [Maridesulfovibrio ferrireducens]|uniref:ABC-F family ATP-binding cassette domain-containing protein n=1 Tax=Maridesulfovibrio ferrireducens TaxID=246191 RepID=UPI001A29207A|nr:ABC-F family ATP-binding cassette domain-containing protein [Maridesulfovibrio ferrireducens]MBI9111637.1 ABC-F family ATP-binding cassette domain-containing protein [Maridesulfovibrio ferrireducens]
MPKVTIASLEKSYNGEDLFSDLTFEVIAGMRLAVTGPNGCGKSTLLKLIAGKIEPDGGVIAISKTARVGYVAQEFTDEDLEHGLLSWVLAALPSWNCLWKEWENAAHTNDQALIERLSERQADLEHQFGYNPEHKARTILTGLGFSEHNMLSKIEELSGGWRERAKLGRVLLQGADILLLDEPTNHLDLEAVEWLENYLLAFRGVVIYVAHDLIFLNRVGTHVLYLGAGKAVVRRGSFTQFLEWRAENSSQRSREAVKLSARIENEYSYINRFKAQARKAAQAQSKLKKVVKLEEELSQIQVETESHRAGRSLAFKMPPTSRGDKAAISVVELEFSYDGRPPSLWPVLNFQLFRGKKVALAAPNGAGKSTLLKVILGQLKPNAGYAKIGQNTSLAYFSQHQSEILRSEATALSEIRRLCDPDTTEEQLKGVLGLFLLGQSYFERPISALSGGEKNRLILASLFLSRANLLILDEPTNHLDLESREGLIAALKDYDGTLFFVAHDRHLLTEVAEEIWALTDTGVEVFQTFKGYDNHRKQALTGVGSSSPAYKKLEVEAKPEKRKLTKEEKRRQADIRNELYKDLKPRLAKYEKLEKDLEKVLEEQSEMEEKLNDPGLYNDSGAAIELNSSYSEACSWSESLMEDMAILEEEIAEIEERKKQLLEED